MLCYTIFMLCYAMVYVVKDKHRASVAMHQHKNPYHGGSEIFNFGKLFLGHSYYSLGLSDLCMGMKIFIEKMYLSYITSMATH